MVTPLDPATAGTVPVRKGLFIGEIVGPAGAGKSTLARALQRQNERLLVDTHPDYKRAINFPLFLRNAIAMLPMFFRLYLRMPDQATCISKRQLAWLVILNGWQSRLQRRLRRGEGSAVLDQGPVFLIATLRMLGPACLRDPVVEHWWKKTYARWAATLDFVLYLDAPDGTLMRRIRTRDKGHEMKEGNAADVVLFLATYRSAYERVLHLLTSANSRIEVIRFDTSRSSVEEIVRHLAAKYDMNAAVSAPKAVSPSQLAGGEV